MWQFPGWMASVCVGGQMTGACGDSLELGDPFNNPKSRLAWGFIGEQCHRLSCARVGVNVWDE